ncbi:MAG: hypothetical protein Q8R29_03995, partial [bacterium]|nr:hypothetical protein [bacterium]
VGGVVIVVLGIGAISGVQYLKYRYSPEYKTYKEAQRLIKEYNEDPYGGNTPEETLQLFIDALKKGDTDLASKYFVMEKWSKKTEELRIGKEKGNLDKLVGIVSKMGSGQRNSTGTYFFSTKDGFGMQLIQTKASKKWKIEEL